MQEGTDVKITVKRDDKIIELPYTLELKERKYKHRLQIIKEQSETQNKYYLVWLGIKK